MTLQSFELKIFLKNFVEEKRKRERGRIGDTGRERGERGERRGKYEIEGEKGRE